MTEILLVIAVMVIFYLLTKEKYAKPQPPLPTPKPADPEKVDPGPYSPPEDDAEDQEENQAEDQYTFNPDVERAAEAINQLEFGEVLFIHGGAGTGKSTLIRELCKRGIIHVCLAPTGLAAMNIKGMTIHKFFTLRPLPHFIKGEDPHKDSGLSWNTREILEFCPTICIDEISMVRADVIDAIDHILRKFYQSDEIFGGLKIIFVGDLYQLPPIIEKAEKKYFDQGDKDWNVTEGWESEYFLDSEVLKRSVVKRIDLNIPWRQQRDISFAEKLNQLRKYENIPECIFDFNKNHAKPIPDSVYLVGNNNVADHYNQSEMDKINSPRAYYHATATGDFLTTKEKNLPMPPKIELKKGAFVMITVNDPYERYVNGSTGRITDLTDDIVWVRLKDKNIVPIEFNVWKTYELQVKDGKREYVVTGTYSQMPILPAWAITIHKSQGKTLDSTYIDINKSFAAGQIYVALSRVRRIEDFRLKNFLSPDDIIINPRLLEFKKQGLI